MRHHQRTTGRTYGDYGDDNRPLALNSISGACFSTAARSICIGNWKSDSQERVNQLKWRNLRHQLSVSSNAKRLRQFNFRNWTFGGRSVDEPRPVEWKRSIVECSTLSWSGFDIETFPEGFGILSCLLRLPRNAAASIKRHKLFIKTLPGRADFKRTPSAINSAPNLGPCDFFNVSLKVSLLRFLLEAAVQCQCPKTMLVLCLDCGYETTNSNGK